MNFIYHLRITLLSGTPFPPGPIPGRVLDQLRFIIIVIEYSICNNII